jgi:hypothetical protein
MQATNQQVVGDVVHAHLHPSMLHTHDHWHVSHHHDSMKRGW